MAQGSLHRDDAKPAAFLYGTRLAPYLPAPTASVVIPTPTHTAKWWAEQTAGMDFSDADRIDAAAFNRVLRKGLKGEVPYPNVGRTAMQ